MNLKNIEKTILVDADGVLLDWAGHFDEWMVRRGHQLQDPNAYLIDYREKSPEDVNDSTS
jgi:FMN phosphatase YigB (HAD superfamily)